MPTLFGLTNPVKEGIKIAGIGKKGSKDLSPELIHEIIASWNDPAIAEATKGAFLGGLLVKGLTPPEIQMFERLKLPYQTIEQLVGTIAPDAPVNARGLCVKLFRKEELTKKEAEELGDFLFSEEPGECLRGAAASILRVRYESADEYEGLLRSVQKTFAPAFQKLVPAGQPIIQLAEPFDGVDHSNMITPLIADYFQNSGFRAVSLVGRNSGPKLFLNLFDIASGLGASFLSSSSHLTDNKVEYGYFLNQADLSKAMDRWVDIRHSTVKRPFLATIERFVNCLSADILIASAFHPPYGEKMLTLAERAGFKATIIVRNGIEGTFGFALLRATKILCSARQDDGTFKRHEFDFDAKEHFQHALEVEEKLDSPSLKDNVNLIKTYKKTGQTDNALFDLRVKATCLGLQQAVDWIKTNNIKNN